MTMTAITADETSAVNGYKMQPRVITEEYTGLRFTLRHMPMRVYMYVRGMAASPDDNWGQINAEALLYAAFSIQQVEGLAEPPGTVEVDIDGTKYTRLDERTMAMFTPGFLIKLKNEIMAYNHLTNEELTKLNFTIA